VADQQTLLMQALLSLTDMFRLEEFALAICALQQRFAITPLMYKRDRSLSVICCFWVFLGKRLL
jgi:hypothetical protein